MSKLEEVATKLRVEAPDREVMTLEVDLAAIWLNSKKKQTKRTQRSCIALAWVSRLRILPALGSSISRKPWP